MLNNINNIIFPQLAGCTYVVDINKLYTISVVNSFISKPVNSSNGEWGYKYSRFLLYWSYLKKKDVVPFAMEFNLLQLFKVLFTNKICNNNK